MIITKIMGSCPDNKFDPIVGVTEKVVPTISGNVVYAQKALALCSLSLHFYVHSIKSYHYIFLFSKLNQV